MTKQKEGRSAVAGNQMSRSAQKQGEHITHYDSNESESQEQDIFKKVYFGRINFSRFKGADFVVLGILAYSVGSDHMTLPGRSSLTYISKQTGKSRQTVVNALWHLQELNFIRLVIRGSNLTHKASTYWVNPKYVVFG